MISLDQIFLLQYHGLKAKLGFIECIKIESKEFRNPGKENHEIYPGIHGKTFHFLKRFLDSNEIFTKPSNIH